MLIISYFIKDTIAGAVSNIQNANSNIQALKKPAVRNRQQARKL